MNITLSVDTYYEYFLSIFGWIMNNRAWNLLLDTGLFALPFVFSILGLFMKAREQGADEGNKGVLLLAWLENYFYMSIFLLFITCVPLFNVNFKIIEAKYDSDCEALRTPIQPQKTAIGQGFTQSTLNGQQAKMPLWWAFTYTIGKGLTHGMINAIPCKPDLRQIQFTIDNVRIKDQSLKNEVAAFNQQCYLPAKARFLKEQNVNKLLPIENSDIQWAGSKILLNGYYQNFHSEKPVKRFPYKQSRDEGFPNTEDGGYPTCKEWWSNPKEGIRARLLKEYDPGFKDKVVPFFKSLFKSDMSSEDIIVQNLIKPKNMVVSDGESVYGDNLNTDFSQQGPDGSHKIADNLSKVAAALGGVAGGLFSKPGFDAMKYTLPMVQALITFMLITLTPFIIVMGSYKIKPIIVLTFAQIGIWFTMYIWRLIQWIDSWLFTAMYQSSTHSNWNPLIGIDNSVGDFFFNFAIGMMYIVAPSIFFMAIGWSGFRVGELATKAVSDSGQMAKKQGDDVSNTTKQVATKAVTKGATK